MLLNLTTLIVDYGEHLLSCRLDTFLNITLEAYVLYQYSPYIKPNYTMLVMNGRSMWLP